MRRAGPASDPPEIAPPAPQGPPAWRDRNAVSVDLTAVPCPTCGRATVPVCMACRGRKGGQSPSPAKRAAARKNAVTARDAKRRAILARFAREDAP